LLFGMSRRWMTNLYNDFLDLAMASIWVWAQWCFYNIYIQLNSLKPFG
jgi:hypothetical protein